MFQIPGTSHRVSWTKQNLLDSAEYFPRAVIRDLRTDVVLDTLDLVNSGDNVRYTKMWNVVQDPSGQGREIEIEITVYEDSGHSTPSGVYGRWTETFTILDLSRMSRGGGGLGGAMLDYDRVREIFGEELTKTLPGMLAQLPKPEMPDLAALVESVDGVKETIGERLRRILGFANKAAAAEEAAVQAREAVAALKEATEAVRTEIAGAREEMRELVSTSNEEIKAAGEEVATLAAETIEESATTAADALKKNVEAAGDTMAKKITASIEETLKKPIKIQTQQEYSLVRDEGAKKEEGAADPRVNRFSL